MIKCPNCNTTILAENLNIQTDIAQCKACQNIFKISENIESVENYVEDGFNLNNNPPGTWLKTDFNKTIIGATTRSAFAFFIIPFMVVWTGLSVGGIYGTQFEKGEFDLFQSLFGIPFILGSVVFWAVGFMAIWGKVEVTLDRQGGKIFTGIWKIGLVKKFLWREITNIYEEIQNDSQSGNPGNSLIFEGNKRISFEKKKKTERRHYILKAVKSVIHKNKWK